MDSDELYHRAIIRLFKTKPHDHLFYIIERYTYQFIYMNSGEEIANIYHSKDTFASFYSMLEILDKNNAIKYVLFLVKKYNDDDNKKSILWDLIKNINMDLITMNYNDEKIYDNICNEHVQNLSIMSREYLIESLHSFSDFNLIDIDFIDQIIQYYESLIEDDYDMTELLIDKKFNFQNAYYDVFLHKKTSLWKLIINKKFMTSFSIIYEKDTSIESDKNMLLCDSIKGNISYDALKLILQNDKIDLISQYKQMNRIIYLRKNDHISSNIISNSIYYTSYDTYTSPLVCDIMTEIINILMEELEMTEENLRIICSNPLLYLINNSIILFKKLSDLLQDTELESYYMFYCTRYGNIDLNKYIYREFGLDKLIQSSINCIFEYEDLIEFYLDIDEYCEIYQQQIVQYFVSNIKYFDKLKKFVRRMNYDLQSDKYILFNASYESLEIIKYLIEIGVSITTVNYLNRTFIHDKCVGCDDTKNMLELLKYMRDVHDFDFNMTDIRGYNCRHLCASNYELVKFFNEDISDMFFLIFSNKIKFHVLKEIMENYEINLNDVDHDISHLDRIMYNCHCNDIIIYLYRLGYRNLRKYVTFEMVSIAILDILDENN